MNYMDYFIVDPTSPTGLRWRDDINEGIKGRGKNNHAGKPAGVVKEITDRTTTLNVMIKGKAHVVARIIWEISNGPIPEGMIIDHLDGDPLNNRITNLACKTRADNMRNRKKASNNKSGVVGVRRQGKSWIAYYQDENKKTVSKSFSDSLYGSSEIAFVEAIAFRADSIRKLNEDFDFNYTERHVGVSI